MSETSENEGLEPGQSCACPHGVRERLTDERNRDHRDMLSSNIVPVGFRDRATGDLANLRSSVESRDKPLSFAG